MGSQFIKCVYVKDTIQNSVYCEPLKVKVHRDIFLSKHICRQFKVYFIFSGFRQIFKIPEITQEITQKKIPFILQQGTVGPKRRKKL